MKTSEGKARNGRLFVLIGPGGSGKTAIIASVTALRPAVRFLPTTTTRPPRPGEVSGREYFFVSPDEFDRLRAAGSLLEWEMIHGHLYGTQRERLSELLARGDTGMTSVDYKGGVAVRRAFPTEAVTIFVQPGSTAELRARLQARPGSSAADIAARLLRAEEEQRHSHEFDHLITNRDGQLDAAVAAVLELIDHGPAARQA